MRFISVSSTWPRELRHELSSLAGTLGSWVRIPPNAWMSVCLFYVCVVLIVGSGLATGWSPFHRVLPTVYKIKKLKKLPRSNKGLWSHRKIEVLRIVPGILQNLWRLLLFYFKLFGGRLWFNPECFENLAATLTKRTSRNIMQVDMKYTWGSDECVT
jgi:hypothetical protein